MSVYWLDLSENVGIHNLGGLSDRIDSIVLRNCGISDVSVIGGSDWYEVDLSGNKGLHGKLKVGCTLKVENCDLDDQFDFLGNDSIEFLQIKGNRVSLNHILESIECANLSCDPISMEEYLMLPEEIAVNDLDVYASMKIPTTIKGQTIQILPAIRHLLHTEDMINESNNKIFDTYEICEGEGIEYDRYTLTGKMQGEQARVKINSKVIMPVSNRTRIFCLNLEIFTSDQMKEESIKIHRETFDRAEHLFGQKPNFEHLKVEKFYEGGYSEFINDYEITGPEVLQFGKNEYLLKCGDFEEKIVIDAIAKIYFETDNIYNACARALVWCGEEIGNVDQVKRMIVLTKYRADKMCSEPLICVESGNIWDLKKLEGLVAFQSISVSYDGQKIDENDLEVLRNISDHGVFVSGNPQLTICYFSKDVKSRDELIVPQNDFELTFYEDDRKEEVEVLNSGIEIDEMNWEEVEENVNDLMDSTTSIREADSLPDVTDSELSITEDISEESEQTVVEDMSEESEQTVVEDIGEESEQSIAEDVSEGNEQNISDDTEEKVEQSVVEEAGEDFIVDKLCG